MTKVCRFLTLAVALAGFIGLRAEPAHGASSPGTLVDLSPGSLGTDSQALCVNGNGDVVGSVLGIDGNQHAFVYTAGSMTLLGGGGSASVAYGINDNGVVVGTLNGQAFAFTAGQATFLAALPGTTTSVATAINGTGVIAGTSTLGATTMGFTGSTTQVSPLGVLPGQAGSVVVGINGGGQTVGSSGGRAFFTIQGGGPGQTFQLVNLGDYLFPGQTSIATGINDHKTVVGTASPDGVSSQGWTYSKGKGTIIPALAGANTCVPNAINSGGVVVGTSGGRAFSYNNGTTTDLSTKIPSGSTFVSLDTAASINGTGVIVGTGTTTDGHQHGFIWMP